MSPSTRREKRPREEVPQATQSVGHDPSYSQPLQAVANLAPPLSQPISATTPADATPSPQGIEFDSEDPFRTPIPITPPGKLTAALDRGAAARETARITRENTVKSVAKALDAILPDVKKYCLESAEGFEKLLLNAIEDLAAARPVTIGAKSSGTQDIPRPFHKYLPSTQTAKNTYAEILGKDATIAKRPKQGEYNRPRNIATDRRVMIRLDKNNPMREHTPFELMKKVNETLGDSS